MCRAKVKRGPCDRHTCRRRWPTVSRIADDTVKLHKYTTEARPKHGAVVSPPDFARFLMRRKLESPVPSRPGPRATLFIFLDAHRCASAEYRGRLINSVPAHRPAPSEPRPQRLIPRERYVKTANDDLVDHGTR